MNCERKSIAWTIFSSFLQILLLSSHDAVAARTNLNFTNLMHEFLLACGYSHFCNPSSLEFVPKDVSPDFLISLGYINECPRCSCKGSCVSEENCCPDLYFKLPESKCMVLEQINFNYSNVIPSHYIDIVDKCQPSHVSTSVSKSCTKEYQKTDQLQNVPVTSAFQTFRNKYCAECNNVTDYEEWGFNIMCNSPADFNYLSSYDDIASLATSRGCVFEYKLYEKGYSLKSCRPQTPMPNRILYYKCNQTGFWRNFDDDVAKACESDYTLTYRFYKNIFCYICNPPSHFVSTDTLISDCDSSIVGQYTHILSDHCRNFGKSSVMQPYKNVFCYLCNVGRQNANDFQRTFKEANAEIYDYFGVDQKNYTNNFLILNIVLKSRAYESFVSKFLVNPDSTKSNKSNIYLYQTLGINITNLLRHEFGYTGHATYCEQYYTQQEFIVPPVNCSCNPTCTSPLIKDSCCSDIEITKPTSCYDNIISKPNPNIQTYNLKYQVIDRCFLDGRNITEKQKYLCENGSGMDIYSIIPIVWNGVTYKNAHCFFCNLDSIPVRTHSYSIDAMDLKLYCDQDIRYGPISSLQALVDIARSSDCHIEVYDRVDMLHRTFAKLYGSQVIQDFIPDGYLTRIETWKYRICNVKETMKCNNTGKWKHYDHDVLLACEKMDHPLLARYRKIMCDICNPAEDNGPVWISSCGVFPGSQITVTNATIQACEEYPDIDGWTPYKNVYCAFCNGLRVSSPPSKFLPGQGPLYNEFNRQLFIFPRYEVGRHISTYKNTHTLENNDETFYDTVNGIIRNITCYPGNILLQGACTPLLRYALNMRYSLNLELVGNVTVYSGDVAMSIRSLTNFLIHKIKYEAGDAEVELTAYITNRPCTIKAYSSSEKFAMRVHMQINFLVQNTIDRQKIEIILVNMTSLTYEYSLARVKARYPRKYVNITHENGHPHNCSSVHLQSVQYTDNYNPVSKLLLCPQTILKPGEFSVHSEEHLLTVNGMKTKLFSEQYVVMENGEARVCVEDLKELMTVETNTKDDSWVFALKITNLICVFLSLLCLLITFIVYCIFPSLRSLPGKNNMTLVMTLFLSQLTLFLATKSSGFPKICMTLGIVSHYFVLCMFASMNICSFHMYSVFVNALYERSSNECKTLTKYLVYIFVSPMLIVGLNVAIVYQITNTIEYGNSRCFITNQISYIISFYIPVILLCVSNTFFFLRTIYAIRHIPKLQSNKKHQNSAKIYAKLFTITGITWILIIIDANFPITAVSFVIVFLNASQGIFIFLSFVCNKKTYRMCTNKTAFSNSSNSPTILQLGKSGSYTISSTKAT